MFILFFTLKKNSILLDSILALIILLIINLPILVLAVPKLILISKKINSLKNILRQLVKYFSSLFIASFLILLKFSSKLVELL